MSSLGKNCYGGTISCERLVAKNSSPTDPHKITGDLEVTGGLQIDMSGFKGVILNSHTSVNQCTIEMNDNTQKWDISADAATSQLSFSHQLNSAPSGAEIAGLTHDPVSGDFGAYFTGKPFRIVHLPTSAAGLPANSVWSNGGVLNITPP